MFAIFIISDFTGKVYCLIRKKYTIFLVYIHNNWQNRSKLRTKTPFHTEKTVGNGAFVFQTHKYSGVSPFSARRRFSAAFMPTR